MAFELSQDIVSALPDEVKSVITKPEVLEVFDKVVSPIVAAKNTLLTEKKSLKDAIDALGGLDKVKADLEELNSVRSMTEEERNKAIKASADVEAVRNDLSSKLKGTQDELNTWKQKFAERDLHTAIAKAVGEDGDFELLLPFIRDRISHKLNDDGRLHIDVLTADGKPMSNATGDAATLNDLISEFKNSQRFSRLFRAEGKAGSGASGQQGTSGLPNNPFKKGPTFNVTEQSRIYRENPTLAKQLAAEAGVQLK